MENAVFGRGFKLDLSRSFARSVHTERRSLAKEVTLMSKIGDSRRTGGSVSLLSVSRWSAYVVRVTGVAGDSSVISK